MKSLFLAAQILFLSSCAYQFGFHSRKLPGGYNNISVPVFKNITQEVGVEGVFTNALIREFERSQVARVSSKEAAPVIIEGQITKVDITPSSQVAASAENEDLEFLPDHTVLDTSYRIVITTEMRLLRTSDKKVIWRGSFTDEVVYNAPQISLPVVNSANPIYNNSAKQQSYVSLARTMMKDVHDRMTERF